MIPPKLSVFTNIGKNLAETLQFEDLPVKNFFLFYYVHIFVEKNLELVANAFFMNVEEKNQQHFAEKSFSVFEGAPFKSFEHTKTFFPQKVFNFVVNIHKKCI